MGRWIPNPGYCPPEAAGKRVFVRLANGSESQLSWPADGHSGCRWSISGHPYDIAEYRVLS